PNLDLRQVPFGGFLHIETGGKRTPFAPHYDDQDVRISGEGGHRLRRLGDQLLVQGIQHPGAVERQDADMSLGFHIDHLERHVDYSLGSCMGPASASTGNRPCLLATSGLMSISASHGPTAMQSV